MSKINLVTVNTPLNSSSFQQEINSNFTAIGEALEKQLQREPQEDINNAMQQELDMNSYRIINLGAPVNPSDAARKQDIDEALKPDLESNRVLISDSEGNISNSSITSTELEALDGISGNIQEQLNNQTTALANLTDVSLSSPANGQVLGFNTSSQKWENVSIREHYRGDYDSTSTYNKGDVVFFGSIVYIATQNVPINTPPYMFEYWDSINQDRLVQYADLTSGSTPDTNKHPIGGVPADVTGLGSSGPMYFTSNANGPTITKQGLLEAPLLKSTTQSQGDNSTNVATTEYVDTALAGVATYNSSTKTLEF